MTGRAGGSGGTPAHARASRHVQVAVVTASDTRGPENDESGRLLVDGLRAAGHVIVHYGVVQDDAATVEQAVLAALDAGAEAVVITGGTGVAPRDQVPEAVARLCDRELPGFGELFRALSFAEIGSAAMASRACAGQRRDRLVFALPGSPAACRLGLERLLLPELAHLVTLARGPERAASGS